MIRASRSSVMSSSSRRVVCMRNGNTAYRYSMLCVRHRSCASTASDTLFNQHVRPSSTNQSSPRDSSLLESRVSGARTFCVRLFRSKRLFNTHARTTNLKSSFFVIASSRSSRHKTTVIIFSPTSTVRSVPLHYCYFSQQRNTVTGQFEK